MQCARRARKVLSGPVFCAGAGFRLVGAEILGRTSGRQFLKGRVFARVKLTMYLLPRSNHGRWRRSVPSGCVLRPDGTEHRIDADEIDGEFAERVAGVMRQLASPEPAVRVPGASECGRCVLTSSECAERIEPGTGHSVNGSQSRIPDAC